MVRHNYNKPYYEIKFSSLDKEGIHVLSFEGEEELSGLYEYRIELVSDDPDLDSSKILNNSATFVLNRGDEDPINIHGIVSNFEQYGKTTDYVFYRITLVPKLWRLNLIHHSEVFQNMDIKSVIEKVMKAGGLQSSNYKIDFKNSYPEFEYIVQYRETSMNFLNRRLEHYGIFYYFDQSGDEDVVVFTDVNNKLPEIETNDPIGYNQNRDPLSEKDSITDITCREKVVTGMVQLKDYNYMFPEKQLMSQSQKDNNQSGTYYDYGDNFGNEKEAEYLAKVRNEEFLCDKKVFNGKSDCRLFKTGYRFKLDKHFRKDWNTEYLITKLSSKGTQENLFAFLPSPTKITPTYQNKFEAIPFDIDYRPKRNASIPKISGIMSAKLESGSGDEYAYLDDHGRYRFKALFDLSDKTNGEASLPVRLAQSYSGPGYGMHFPNHAGTELIWACVDGNVDKPLGLGTVPNPSQASPVASKNKTQNIIRTASGNEFIMDDKSKEAQIIMTTPDANKILLDDKDDKIEVTSKDKHKILMDDKNQNITIITKEGHTILLDDKNTKIEVTSKKGHFLLIDDKDGQEKIQVSDKPKKNNFIIDIKNNKLVIETKEGGIDMLAPKGEINIKSTSINLESKGDTTLSAANIKSEAKQDYKMKATQINQEASTAFKLKGATFEAKGDTEAKVEGGATLELKGGATAKLSGGAITAVEGSGQTSVKGAIVMIN
jgi:type VI secretion system secreted protein VgrG